MFGLKQKHIDDIYSCFARFSQIEKVIVYGSRAMGNYRPGSDIDLTIVGDLNRNDLIKLETLLDDLLLPYKIDLSILNQIHSPELSDHIHRHGLVFYQKVDDLVFREPKSPSDII